MRIRYKKIVFTGFLAIILVMAGFSGCSLFPREEEALSPPLAEPEKITYKTEEAKIGYVEDSIQRTGYFVPIMQENLFFHYRSGRIKAVHVIIGDTVKAGDVIAELLTGDLEKEIDLQQILVDSREKDCTYTEQLAEIEIQAAKDKHANLSNKYRDMEKNAGAYAANEIENARERMDEQKLLADKLILNYANQIELKKNELAMARLKLRQLQTELDQCKLISPVSGIVTYTLNINEGDMIDAYRTIASVADPRVLQLEYQGNSASDFKLGMQVDITINKAQYTGEVILTAASVPFEEMDKFKDTIRIKIENLPEEVEKGDRAEIKLVRDYSENAVIVPLKAVRLYLGKEIAYVLKDGLRVERYVETGVKSASEVEIIKGIEEGEQVIVE